MKINFKKIVILLSLLLSIVFLSSCMEDDKNSNDDNIIENESSEIHNIDEDEKVMKQEVMEEQEVIIKNKETLKKEALPSSWEYIDYTAEELKNSKNENIVLFFHSKSCWSCKKTDDNLTWSNLPEWLTVLKLEYDEHREIQKKYWITHWHNFVQVDRDWNMIKKWAWSFTLEDIVSKLSTKKETIEEKISLSWTYKDYDSSLIWKTNNTVLFFHATWCPSCKSADKKPFR